MPTLTTLALTNKDAATVNFTPSRIDKNDVAIFRDTSGTKPIGFPTVSSVVKEPGVNGEVYRVSLRLNLPEIATVTVPGSSDGTAEVVRNNRANIEFILPNQSEKAVRQNLLAYLKSALANADIEKTILDVESFY